MTAVRIACPNCSSTLKTAQALTAGKKVRCPRCGVPFSVNGDGAAQPSAYAAPANGMPPYPAAAPPAAYSAPLAEVQPYPSAPPTVAPEGEPAPPSSNRALLLGSVLGGLVLLAGAAIGLALLFSGGNQTRDDKDKDKGNDDKQVHNTPAADGNRPTDKPQDDAGPRTDRPPPKPDPKPEPPAFKPSLPPDQQKQVDDAVAKGVAYLKRTQGKDGYWPGANYRVAFAALPALTLLECGAPKNDEAVQKAAAYVRQNVSNLASMNDRATYQIACAILFLDRLGDPQDEVLIQTLGLRLIAAQTAAGGWWYPCPQLSEADAKSLLAALELTRPQSSRELLLTETGDGLGAKGGDGTTGAKDAPRKDDKAEKARAENLKKVVDGLPANLKTVAAMKSADENAKLPDGDQSDNSNTQFALLGVWVAGRHKVPTERALALVSRRFRASQAPAGLWAYNYSKRNNGGTDTMTGAGLLGLAVGHGLDAGDKRDDGVRKKVDDESIKKGLAALSRFIGDGKTPVRGKALNLYFLWTVERVGMLYQAQKIGDKDWYAWGAMEIVAAQTADGHWQGGWGGPPIETSFALLFLQRANLVKDLSNKVEFVIDSSK